MKEHKTIVSLSHSYFCHMLRDVQPFLEYFETDLLSSYFKTTTHVDSELVERIFFMAVLNSTDMSLPFDYSNNYNHKITKSEWLTNLNSFGNKSKQGMVHRSLIFNRIDIVTKTAKTSKFNQITLRDFCVGINLNKILNEAPFFVRTIGCYKLKNQFYIATEFIDGINLKTFLQNKKNTFTMFLNIFFQILLGLEIAQNKLNFAHYDLHTDNVILVPQNQQFSVSLYGYNYTIKHIYRPIMIDFGLSSICTKGQTLGQTSLETKEIYGYLSPGYDIYVFLLFCLDIAQKYNVSIFKGITELLLFFKTQTDLSLDILTNNHIKCLRKGVSNIIPYKFIQYLIKHFPNDLEVEIEPKTYNDKYLRKPPLFLKLKKIFDPNDELSILRYNSSTNIEYKKGFIRSLIKNIKIYYWYRDKVDLTPKQIQYLFSMDKCNLQNLIDDLNLKITKKGEITPSITVEQKNLFFIGLDYYYLILELELQHHYSYYKEWLYNFKDTFVFKNIFNQLDTILQEERYKRCNKF